MLNFGKIKQGSKVKEIVIMDYYKRIMVNFQNFGKSIAISFFSDNKKDESISLSIKPEDGITFRSLVSKYINLFDNTPIKISEVNNDMIISVPSKERFYIIWKVTEENMFNGFLQFMIESSQSMPEIKEKTIINFCKTPKDGIQKQMKPAIHSENK